MFKLIILDLECVSQCIHVGKFFHFVGLSNPLGDCEFVRTRLMVHLE